MILVWFGLLNWLQDAIIAPMVFKEGHSADYCNIARWYSEQECKLILYLDDTRESRAVKELLGTNLEPYHDNSEYIGTIEARQATFLKDQLNHASRFCCIVVKHDTDSDVRQDIPFPSFAFAYRQEPWQFKTTRSLDIFLIAMEIRHIAELRRIVYNIVQNGTEWKKKSFELEDGLPILRWDESHAHRDHEDWSIYVDYHDLVVRGPMGPPNHKPTRKVTETWSRTIVNDLGFKEEQQLVKKYTIPGNRPVSTLLLYTDHGTLELIQYYITALISEGQFPPIPVIIP